MTYIMSKFVNGICRDEKMDNKTETISKYIYWKWSKEDYSPVIKSKRGGRVNTMERDTMERDAMERDAMERDMNTFPQQEEVNKRAVCYSRISQRALMIQT